MILAEPVGLRRPVVLSIIKTIKTKMGGVLQMIGNSYMPEEMKQRAHTVVTDRVKAIQLMELYVLKHNKEYESSYWATDSLKDSTV